jgi:hypothetical protein
LASGSSGGKASGCWSAWSPSVTLSAVAYVLLGAIPDLKSAMLFSLNALTSYGHTHLLLAPHWRLMGALESLNGVLLFGLTVASLFAVIQHVLLLSSRLNS